MSRVRLLFSSRLGSKLETRQESVGDKDGYRPIFMTLSPRPVRKRVAHTAMIVLYSAEAAVSMQRAAVPLLIETREGARVVHPC
jgi:hypothetical protein